MTAAERDVVQTQSAESQVLFIYFFSIFSFLSFAFLGGTLVCEGESREGKNQMEEKKKRKEREREIERERERERDIPWNRRRTV